MQLIYSGVAGYNSVFITQCNNEYFQCIASENGLNVNTIDNNIFINNINQILNILKVIDNYQSTKCTYPWFCEYFL